MSKKFLDKVYDLDDVDETRILYDQWSDNYDNEVGNEGYITPARIAQALKALTKNPSLHNVLDFGCGTGLSGQELHKVGFTNLDGCDMSANMLGKAREKSIYQKLWQIEPGQLDVKTGAYSIVTAVGVVSKGAAPPETLEMLFNILPQGGLLAFSYNEHTLEEPAYMEQIERISTGGHCIEHLREDGEHLPGLGLRSTIFIFEYV